MTKPNGGNGGHAHGNGDGSRGTGRGGRGNKGQSLLLTAKLEK